MLWRSFGHSKSREQKWPTRYREISGPCLRIIFSWKFKKFLLKIPQTCLFENLFFECLFLFSNERNVWSRMKTFCYHDKKCSYKFVNAYPLSIILRFCWIECNNIEVSSIWSNVLQLRKYIFKSIWWCFSGMLYNLIMHVYKKSYIYKTA